MTEYSAIFGNTKTSKIVFILSVIVSLFWIFGQIINVYHFALVGAIFEMLWFPVVAMTAVLPIVSIIFLIKEKFSFRSLYLYSFFIVATTILALVFRK
jgi:hypothetical protein